MNPLLLLSLLGVGGYVVYEKKKNPNWNPIASLTGKKSAALSQVAATSTPTPSATAGLDPNMTSAQVAQMNALLAAGTDANAMYALASSFSSLGFNNSAKALIAKADAITTAKQAGAADTELEQQMLAASGSSTLTQQAGSGVAPGVNVPGVGNLFG